LTLPAGPGTECQPKSEPRPDTASHSLSSPARPSSPDEAPPTISDSDRALSVRKVPDPTFPNGTRLTNGSGDWTVKL